MNEGIARLSFGDRPDPYADLCAHVREHAGAAGAMVIVFGGNSGPGCSLQVEGSRANEFFEVLPDVLEMAAAKLRDRDQWVVR